MAVIAQVRPRLAVRPGNTCVMALACRAALIARRQPAALALVLAPAGRCGVRVLPADQAGARCRLARPVPRLIVLQTNLCATALACRATPPAVQPLGLLTKPAVPAKENPGALRLAAAWAGANKALARLIRRQLLVQPAIICATALVWRMGALVQLRPPGPLTSQVVLPAATSGALVLPGQPVGAHPHLAPIIPLLVQMGNGSATVTVFPLA